MQPVMAKPVLWSEILLSDWGVSLDQREVDVWEDELRRDENPKAGELVEALRWKAKNRRDGDPRRPTRADLRAWLIGYRTAAKREREYNGQQDFECRFCGYTGWARFSMRTESDGRVLVMPPDDLREYTAVCPCKCGAGGRMAEKMLHRADRPANPGRLAALRDAVRDALLYNEPVPVASVGEPAPACAPALRRVERRQEVAYVG
jgi:hypothetical protein